MNERMTEETNKQMNKEAHEIITNIHGLDLKGQVSLFNKMESGKEKLSFHGLKKFPRYAPQQLSYSPCGTMS